jgi:hypothetical protein
LGAKCSCLGGLDVGGKSYGPLRWMRGSCAFMGERERVSECVRFVICVSANVHWASQSVRAQSVEAAARNPAHYWWLTRGRIHASSLGLGSRFPRAHGGPLGAKGNGHAPRVKPAKARVHLHSGWAQPTRHTK